MTTAHFPIAAPRRAPAAGATRTAVLWLVGAIAAHVLFAFVLREQRSLGGLHAAATFAVVLGCAARAPLAWLPGLLMYVAGSEVLWRASKAGVPWEAAKYLVILACGLALVRIGRRARWPLAPILYFLLLLPSVLALLGDPQWSLNETRQRLATGLAAPLALTMSAWFLAHVELPPERMHRAFLAFVLPCVTLAAYTAITTYTSADIAFGRSANAASSGGFGPNQVSTSLGLAAFLALVIGLANGVRLPERAIALAVACGTMIQTAMTFSRGGLYAAAGALLVVMPFLLVDRRAWFRALLLTTLVVVGTGALFLRADQFTGGALNERLQNTNPTGRDRIANDDIDIWLRHPVVGVGPSAASRHRASGIYAASHTEFTRVLAEHGTLGAIGVMLLVASLAVRILRAPSAYQRMIVLGLLVWSALTMMHAAMRLVAPALIVGFAFARYPVASTARAVRASWSPAATARHP